VKTRPVVALDLDGTLLDYHRHFLVFAAGYLGTWDPEEPAYLAYDARIPLHKWLRVSKTTYRECKLAYRRGQMKRSVPALPPPLPQAGELTRQLRRWGADIWICTTRPYLSHDEVDDATRHSLRRNGVQYQGIIWGERKYHELVRTVGKDRVAAVLDDLPEMCTQAAKLGLPAGFALRPHNRLQFTQLHPGTLYPAYETHDDTLAWLRKQLDTWKVAQK
jgi:phosphoglycolate phosphatase-like HAD superfamily hydrolase